MEYLSQYGYWGMLIAAFLAGSFFPFSSEAIMLSLLAAGLEPWPLVAYGTVGNVAGSVFNYSMGRLGNLQWIERHLHVKQRDLDKAQRFMAGHGAWMGFFAFLPILGSAITILLGLMRANIPITLTSITIGKLLRYILLVGTIALTSCTPSASHAPHKIITVSIEPLRYFTEAIAGNHYKVTTLVPKQGNPEIYEPDARQLQDLSESSLLILVGDLGFEKAWEERLSQAAPHTKIVHASAGIHTVSTSHGHTDPHTWMSTTNALLIARNIYHALVAIDATDSVYFKRNLDKLNARIQTLDTEIRQQLAHHTSPSFLIYHPSLTYFARDYGLQQIVIEEEGREPSVTRLHSVIATARQKGAKQLLVQQEFDKRNALIVAEETGTELVDINPLAYDWEKEMMETARKLK